MKSNYWYNQIKRSNSSASLDQVREAFFDSQYKIAEAAWINLTKDKREELLANLSLPSSKYFWNMLSFKGKRRNLNENQQDD